MPERYEGLRETESADYAVRTEWNVRDADATVVFSFGPPTGGSALTVRLAERHARPVLVLDLEAVPRETAAHELAALRTPRWPAAQSGRSPVRAGRRTARPPTHLSSRSQVETDPAVALEGLTSDPHPTRLSNRGGVRGFCLNSL